MGLKPQPRKFSPVNFSMSTVLYSLHKCNLIHSFKHNNMKAILCLVKFKIAAIWHAYIICLNNKFAFGHFPLTVRSVLNAATRGCLHSFQLPQKYIRREHMCRTCDGLKKDLVWHLKHGRKLSPLIKFTKNVGKYSRFSYIGLEERFS